MDCNMGRAGTRDIRGREIFSFPLKFISSLVPTEHSNLYYKDPKQLKVIFTSNIPPYPSQPGSLVRPVIAKVLRCR